MQYQFDFPDNYAMDGIRSRVAERGPAFDKIEGLTLKAFLITDRSAGASANTYAPYYVWRDEAALSAFLSGALFDAVSMAFGRPAVRRPLSMQFDFGSGAWPRVATIESVPATSKSLADVWAGEAKLHNETLARHGLFARSVALDTASWQIERFTLWKNVGCAAPLSADVQLYEVLHLAAPALGARD
jgi:hypothetical protein